MCRADLAPALGLRAGGGARIPADPRRITVMARTWWDRLFRERGRPARGPRWRPQLDLLEDRTAPAVFEWDGGGTTNFWTDRFNWVGDVAPATDGTADLVFNMPTDPTSFSNTNNFTAGTTFNSI